MGSHEFALKLNRQVSAEEVDALYEAGCRDAAIESGPLGTLMDFTREAPTLAEALVSAVRDIDKVPGLRAVGVDCDNMVSLRDIAERAGVTSEAVRLWSTGQRRPGNFPTPIAMAGNEKFWDWQQVAAWLKSYREPPLAAFHVSITAATLCMADRVLAARDALRSEPDEAVREEFERLLQEA